MVLTTYLQETSVEHPVIEAREPLLQLQLQPHPARLAATSICADADPDGEQLHPPLAEHRERVVGATGDSTPGLDAVDAHSVEHSERSDEPGGAHLVDEQLGPGACRATM